MLAEGTCTPKPNTLQTNKKQSTRMVELSGLMLISMPANYFGQVWFCSLLCSSDKPTHNYWQVTVPTLTGEGLSMMPEGLPHVSGTE